MSEEVKKSISKYCYNSVKEEIQFTTNKDIYTPNNIRRLVISTDGFIVQYHKYSRFKITFFSSMNDLCNCINSVDYTPMVHALSAKGDSRLCGSIEEVVFCTGSLRGLALRETPNDIIVTNTFKNRIDSLKSTYKRLRGIVVFNGSISDLYKSFGLKMQDKTYQLCDDAELSKYASVISVNKEWYKFSGLRSNYAADNDGGKLSTIFNSVERKMELKNSIDSKQDSLSKLNSAKLKELKIMEDNFIYILKSILKIESLSNKLEHSYIASEYCSNLHDDTKRSLSSLKLRGSKNSNIFSDNFKKYAQSIGLSIEDSNESSSAIISSNTEALKHAYLSLYNILCTNLLSLIEYFLLKFPLASEVKLSNINKSVFFPKKLQERYNRISDKCNLGSKASEFSSKYCDTYISNICQIYSMLYFSDCNPAYNSIISNKQWDRKEN